MDPHARTLGMSLSRLAGETPKPVDLSCIHRGDELRRVGCQTCRGSVQVKIYACAVFSECSLSANAGVKCCAGCGERATASSTAGEQTDRETSGQTALERKCS